MNDTRQDAPPITIIRGEGQSKLIDWSELIQYRDLFYFLVWRDIKTRYAQSVLGVGWAIIQPVFSMIVFTIVFGNLANVDSDGVPYAIFSYAAVVPWTFFSQSLTASSSSLTASSNLLTKVYFPRLIIPIAPILSKLVDFMIAFVILIGMLFFFPVQPTIWALFTPVLLLILILCAAGAGMWLTALAVQYRDINYGLGFAVQLLMYAAPVVYPASNVPDQFRLIYGLFPMAGVIEGFRSALLGSNEMPWDLIGIGALSAIALFISGIIYFRRMERIFADVV